MTTHTLTIDRPCRDGFAVTPWGEMIRPRLRRRESSGGVAILDYRAPAGFGPPRHLHRSDDEVFLLQAGHLALWMPDVQRVARLGDLVFLPRGVAHTWRSFGTEDVRFQLIVIPGDFEPFLEIIAQEQLQAGDVEGLSSAASRAGMDITGSPLTDAEVASISSEAG